MLRRHARLAATLFCLMLAALACLAQEAPSEYDLREHYTKYEFRIPMRDGVRLFTAVYAPKDRSRSYPFLINRTPYSVAPYGVDRFPKRLGPSSDFDRAGYIFVMQDVRGRYMSEGHFVEMRPHIDVRRSNKDVDDSTDLYDTLEWLLKNVSGNNGRAGIWGISYPGFFTSASIVNSHPSLKAASPEAPMTNLFMGDDAYHNGAFMLNANFRFYAYFQPQNNPNPPEKADRSTYRFETKNGYDFFLKLGPLATAGKRHFGPGSTLFDDQAQHNAFDDYWQARNLAPHLKNIRCAVLTVGGWFDAEDLQGPFTVYKSIGDLNPQTENHLVVGPWVHGGWARHEGRRLGAVDFAGSTGDYYRKRILFPFFEEKLKDAPAVNLAPVIVFETGSNEWRSYESWPPKNVSAKKLYLRAGGRLSFEPPASGEAAFDEYVSDPGKPVPYVNYPTLSVPQEYMVSDQRFASQRPDVLAYVSEPLETDVAIAGPVKPHLFVSTTGTDSDFDVKLIDVYPEDYPTPEADAQHPNDVVKPPVEMGGYQQLVRGEPFRGKFRNSWERPEPFTPGAVTPLNFELTDVNHVFRKGHRIMVQIQSSWFPLTDRNPQKFMNIAEAQPEDYQKATERVYHKEGEASAIEVGLLPAQR